MASVIGPTPLRNDASVALNVVCAADESAVDALCAERLVRSPLFDSTICLTASSRVRVSVNFALSALASACFKTASRSPAS